MRLDDRNTQNKTRRWDALSVKTHEFILFYYCLWKSWHVWILHQPQHQLSYPSSPQPRFTYHWNWFSPPPPSLPLFPPVTWRLAVTRRSLRLVALALWCALETDKRQNAQTAGARPSYWDVIELLRLFRRACWNPLKSLLNDPLLNGLFLVTHRSHECLETGSEPEWCCAVSKVKSALVAQQEWSRGEINWRSHLWLWSKF